MCACITFFYLDVCLRYMERDGRWGLGDGGRVRLGNRGGVGAVQVSMQKTDRRDSSQE